MKCRNCGKEIKGLYYAGKVCKGCSSISNSLKNINKLIDKEKKK